MSNKKALDTIKDFNLAFVGGCEKTMRGTAASVFSQSIEVSPVRTGRFKGGWVATGAKPSTRAGSSDKNGSKTIEKMMRVIMGNKDWSVFTLTNNTPHAIPLEYGLYPNPVKKGTWDKEKGKYEIRSTGGFSNQATEGIVRPIMARAKAELEKQAKRHLP